MVGIRVSERENYTAAARTGTLGAGRWPAAEGDVAELCRSAGWSMWAGPAPGEDDEHKHTSDVRLPFHHHHAGGVEPHDHLPGRPS